MEQDAFNEHVISYLVKLEVEVQALRLALEAEEGAPVSREQIDVFRALAHGRYGQTISEQIRREFAG